MINQQVAENAQEFYFQKAESLAEYKAEMEYLMEFRKSKKAILSNQFLEENPKSPEWKCNNYAYAHPEYLEILEGIKEGIARYEKLRFQMESAKMKVNIWQTQSANQRV